MRRKRKESEARQAMRSEGSEQVCLLADYLELRKIKRHTHIQCSSSFALLSLSLTHRGDWSTAGCYPRNSIWGKEKLSWEREARGETGESK